MKIKTFSIEDGESYEKVITEILKTSCKIILIKGCLGAGKTTFTSEFIEKLNANKKAFSSIGVMSPTFSIINEYKLNDMSVMHADFYRVSEESFEVEEVLESIESSEFSFIEWYEKFPSLKNYINDYVCVEISKLNESKREVSIECS